ncbi:MAG: response regulator [Muribaculaceae bacterium]|nr:response regulator [Muribaculaceae bacterium]
MAFNKIVLVVDDKPVIGKMVSMALKGLPLECIYHNNPRSCIKWLADNNLPDLVITDLRMPGMSGNRFVKYLKEDERYKNIPVMVISSEDAPEDRIDLYGMGALHYVVKPFNPADIKSRVADILNV